MSDSVLSEVARKGRDTYRRTRDFDAVEQAGRDFYKSLNYQPKGQAQVAALEQQLAALKQQAATAHAEKNDLQVRLDTIRNLKVQAAKKLA